MVVVVGEVVGVLAGVRADLLGVDNVVVDVILRVEFPARRPPAPPLPELPPVGGKHLVIRRQWEKTFNWWRQPCCEGNQNSNKTKMWRNSSANQE